MTDVERYAEYFGVSEEEARTRLEKHKGKNMIHISELGELKLLDTDDRGRVNLGSEYKNSTVKVAIVEVVENG